MAAISRLVHRLAFESGLVEIQNGKGGTLTQDEKKLCLIFLLTNETSDNEEDVGSNDEDDENYSFIIDEVHQKN